MNISTIVPLTNNTLTVNVGSSSTVYNATTLPDYSSFSPPALPVNQLRYSIQQANLVCTHGSRLPGLAGNAWMSLDLFVANLSLVLRLFVPIVDLAQVCGL